MGGEIDIDPNVRGIVPVHTPLANKSDRFWSKTAKDCLQ